jgi:hypothetical protein
MEVQRKIIVSRVYPDFLKQLKKICADKEITVNDLIIKLLVKEFPELQEKNQKV